MERPGVDDSLGRNRDAARSRTLVDWVRRRLIGSDRGVCPFVTPLSSVPDETASNSSRGANFSNTGITRGEIELFDLLIPHTSSESCSDWSSFVSDRVNFAAMFLTAPSVLTVPSGSAWFVTVRVEPDWFVWLRDFVFCLRSVWPMAELSPSSRRRIRARSAGDGADGVGLKADGDWLPVLERHVVGLEIVR